LNQLKINCTVKAIIKNKLITLIKILLLVFIYFIGHLAIAQQRQTLLAIFHHPDDDTAIAEVLVKYVGETIWL